MHPALHSSKSLVTYYKVEEIGLATNDSFSKEQIFISKEKEYYLISFPQQMRALTTDICLILISQEMQQGKERRGEKRKKWKQREAFKFRETNRGIYLEAFMQLTG